jgi:hypothetical protein
MVEVGRLNVRTLLIPYFGINAILLPETLA